MTCHEYGINGGCDSNCPVIWEGKCEQIQEGIDKKLFSEEELKELKSLYKKSIKIQTKKSIFTQNHSFNIEFF